MVRNFPWEKEANCTMTSEGLREQNRQRLINSAAKLFLRQGIQETSMGQVADGCGLTRRTAVNIFGSKDHLILLTVEKILQENIDRDTSLFQSREFLEKSGLQQVLFLLDHRADLLFQRPVMFLLVCEMQVYMSLHRISFDQNAWLRSQYRLLDEAMADALQKGIADSSIRYDVEAEKAFQLLTGTYRGLLHRLSISVNDPSGEQVEEAKKELRVFLDTAIYYLTQRPLLGRAPKSRRILIVDDIELNRDALSSLFQEEYEVVTACNGEEGLLDLRAHPETLLVILDLLMPVMDGFEFLKAVRQDSRFDNVAIVVNTAYGEDKNESRALRLGADEFISKPYNSDIVKYRIQNLLSRFEKASSPQNAVPESFRSASGGEVSP